MKISLTQFIGPNDAAWERVALAFQAYDFKPPSPEFPGAGGAFVANIVPQYVADLSQNEVLAIIEYGLTNTIERLHQSVGDPGSLLYTPRELGEIYADTYGVRP